MNTIVKSVARVSLPLLASALTLFLFGCASPPPPKPNLPATSLHLHQVVVTNEKGEAVIGARVAARVADLAEVVEEWNETNQFLLRPVPEVFCTTNESGRCTIEVSAKLRYHSYAYWSYLIPSESKRWCIDDCWRQAPKMLTTYEILARKNPKGLPPTWGYASYISLNVYGGGLFGPVFAHDVALSSSATPHTQTVAVRGTAVQEYFCPSLLAPSAKALSDSLVTWSRSIAGQVAVSNTEISRRGGLCTSEFKGNRYLALTLTSTLRFNSAKLNSYGVGASIFDDTIRGILGPLGGASSALALYGYDITIKTKKENFLNPGNVAESRDLEYRFLIPRSVAAEYKNKDITGQQVIDRSLVLLNDERIDLKLQ